ncbi:MAG TPA: AAA family ATPase [Phycisphaeraceae bacterium]
MYETFYNLERLPFENTPDPRFFYASEQHREALAAMEYTIRQRKGIVLVTGDIGSGKTTISRTMLQRCADQATLAQVLPGRYTGPSLARHVMRSLGLTAERGDDHAKLLERLRTFLVEQDHLGKPVVVLVDEAQCLSNNAMESLRLLSNFDDGNRRLLQLVLVGQPELRDRLKQTELAALRQRIVLAKQVEPLAIHDMVRYLAHRLRAASRNPDQVWVSFSGEALQQIHAFTRGIPRLINTVCDNCLLLGYTRNARRITADMVRHVLADVMPNFDHEADSTSQPKLSLAGNF